MSKTSTRNCFINGIEYYCRLCFDPGREFYSLTDNCGSSKTWRDLLNEIVVLQVNDEDVLPKTVCCKCSNKLTNSYNFLCQIRNVTRKYYQLLGDSKHQFIYDIPKKLKTTLVLPESSRSSLTIEQCVSDIKLERECMTPCNITVNENSALPGNENADMETEDEHCGYQTRVGTHKFPYRSSVSSRIPSHNVLSKYTLENINTYTNSWMTPAVINQLEKLLNKWNFGCLLPILYEECIDIEALKLMTSQHIKQIAKKWNLNMGIQIKFEKCITSWREADECITNCTSENSSKVNDYTNEVKHVSAVCDAMGRTDVVVDIERILKSSSQGKSVLEYFKRNEKLNEGSRSVIVDLIISYLIHNDIRMTVKLSRKLAEDIVKVFPNESMEYYYLQQIGRKPQGKLYDKFFNSMRKLKQSGVIFKRPYYRKREVSNKRIINIDFPEQNIETNIEALQLDECSWPEIENHWAATKNYRLHELSQAASTTEFLNKWFQYKKPLGYELVDIDFRHLYPRAEKIHDRYDDFCFKINDIFKDRIKDPTCKLLYQNMDQMENISENGRCVGNFYLLPSILVPSACIFNEGNGKKTCTRFSIRDSQRSIFVEGNTIEECEEEALKLCETKTQSQPLVLISGSILEPNEITVYFENIKYDVSSALDAIDICFKIYLVFNLEYPKESLLVWSFIQKYFYNITTNADFISASINSLSSDLK